MKITSVSLISMLILGLFLITAGCTQSQPEVAASTPQVTDIVGVWTGTTTGYTTTAGFRESNTTYTITAQKGPAFFGSKVYTRWDNNEYSENLSGVISTAGRSSLSKTMMATHSANSSTKMRLNSGTFRTVTIQWPSLSVLTAKRTDLHPSFL